MPHRSADGYLRSALKSDDHDRSMQDVADWLEQQRAATPCTVRRIPLDGMTQWGWVDEPRRLAHRSGKFFSVSGVRVTTDTGPVSAWDQPILVQPEIGILGILTKTFDGLHHFLMQAKVEPGNINGVQLSPTVQATRSNYMQVHAGSAPAYAQYFREPGRGRVILNQLQSEQASRYYRKQNRNVIVELDDDQHVDVAPQFCWMTLVQIKTLLKQPNMVNMDTRTVLACLPLLGRQPTGDRQYTDLAPPLADALPLSPFGRALLDSTVVTDRAVHSLRDVMHWLTDLQSHHEMHVEPRALDRLDGWAIDADAIRHQSGKHFSVIAVDVETGAREVQRWQQPLLEHDAKGLNGFLVQRINGVLHFLVRACAYPGNRQVFDLGSTVSRSNADDAFGRGYPPFLDLFRDPPHAWVRYSGVQSEEGGRFYHYQNRYVILELPEGHQIDDSPIHHWMTLGQIQELLPHGYFNIEGRNLLACLDLCDTTTI